MRTRFLVTNREALVVVSLGRETVELLPSEADELIDALERARRSAAAWGPGAAGDPRKDAPVIVLTHELAAGIDEVKPADASVEAYGRWLLAQAIRQAKGANAGEGEWPCG